MYKFSICDHNWLILKNQNEAFQKLGSFLSGMVIDLGCGSAPYKDDILDLGLEYVGIDWPYGWHGSISVNVFADLSRPLPIRDSSADTITSFQVLEHLAEPASFLTECRRILKPGGGLVISVPFMWHVHEAPHDYFRYTNYGLEYLLEKAGFTAITIQPTTGFWQMWILKLNYYTKHFARGPLKIALIPLWYLGQIVAPFLDRLDHRESETAGYIVTARRPE